MMTVNKDWQKNSAFNHLLNFINRAAVKSQSSLTAFTTLWWQQLKENRLLAIVYDTLLVCYTYKFTKHTNYTHTCGQKINGGVQSCYDSLESVHVCWFHILSEQRVLSEITSTKQKHQFSLKPRQQSRNVSSLWNYANKAQTGVLSETMPTNQKCEFSLKPR